VAGETGPAASPAAEEKTYLETMLIKNIHFMNFNKCPLKKNKKIYTLYIYNLLLL
jgi:hypothetical protein